jgi:hypothetical protein
MKVLIVHNSYKQSGGEEVAVAHEAALLRLAGHEVIEYHRSNHEMYALRLWGKLTLLTFPLFDPRRDSCGFGAEVP